MNEISSPEALRAHFGEPSAMVVAKALPKLDPHCRTFIALSPFLVLATTDGDGNVDASPRGDAPGFVQVLDDSTLLLPDRIGNRRIDSFRNILAHPGVGLLFMVPGIGETVRVNGTATITTDVALLARAEAQGKVPGIGMLIAVREAFFHCGKAMIRSKLWDPAVQVERKTFPTLGRIVADQTKLTSAEEADRNIETAYRDRLY